MRVRLQDAIAYLFIGFTAGYLTAAVAVARHWNRIP